MAAQARSASTPVTTADRIERAIFPLLFYKRLCDVFDEETQSALMEFYTNRTVVRLMTEMLEPWSGESIYDPNCPPRRVHWTLVVEPPPGVVELISNRDRAGSEGCCIMEWSFYNAERLFARARKHIAISGWARGMPAR